MSGDLNVDEIAGALYEVVSVLSRRARLRAATDEGLSLPERSVLKRVTQGGPSTAAELARAEQIRPQGMGLILGRLEERGLIERHADPDDGRRLAVSVTAAGSQTLAAKRNKQTELLATMLASGFDRAELQQFAEIVPLFERLAEQI
jgi:DNA-binding MarR family transcriptional regulator